MTFTLVATVKDEGPYLWEWVAYHRMIGFDHIIIFQNNSTDGTHEILAQMAKSNLITYKYNKAARGRHQVRAYVRASGLQPYLEADWVMALDLDEFLVIHPGKNTLHDLLDVMPTFDWACVNWLRFGNSGHISPPDGLVSEAFTRCDDVLKLSTGMEAFKSFFRRTAFKRPGVHVPRGAVVPRSDISVVNGSGLKEDEFKLKNFRCSDPSLLKYAQVNHYIVRDAASFVLKSAKGSAHQADREIGRDYWANRNKNTDENLKLSNLVPRIRVAMDEMDQLSGGKLAELTAASRAKRNVAIKSTLKEDWAKDLYEFCVQTRR